MTRKKSTLRQYLKRYKATEPGNIKEQRQPKRKFEKTPQKPFSIKSPFKSPTYQLKSPSTKRLKPSRTLFSPIKSKITENEDALSEETLSGLEECDVLSSDEENAAPSKESDENSFAESSFTERLIELAPSVMKELAKYDGMDETALRFFELVAKKEFPMENIALLLWMDVVKWFSCSSTTEMRYADQTKLFWKLGWRIFGKRFVNYMGGFKNHGELVLNDSSIGQYNPSSGVINFAVPDVSVLRGHDPYAIDKERTPGIFIDTIDKMSKCLDNKSACITFDGKKLKQGLTKTSGDVDLLGFEKGDSLDDRKTHLYSDLEDINYLIQDCHGNSEFASSEVIQALKKHVAKLAQQQGEIEKVKTKREYSKKKLIDASGPDWKHGKYMYAISAITAYIHDIDSYLDMARHISDKLCRHIAFLNKEKFVDDRLVNLEKIESYLSIADVLPTQENVDSPRHIVQRSDEWWELRKQAKITGSTLYKALACDGLGKQKEHFEKVICGVPEKEPSPEAKLAMAWGTENEINAVATVVGKIMPVFEPGLKFCEEGCVPLTGTDGTTFFVVSPDGSLRRSQELHTTEVAVEIKCPTRNVHSEFPERYVLQCQAEMQALGVDRLMYVSWTEKDTTVFSLERDDELLDTAIALAEAVYSGPNPRKPTKLTDEARHIKAQLREKAKQIEVVGRFTSCKQAKQADTVDFDMKHYTSADLVEVLNDVSKCYNERYELLRQKATEAVVFLLADLDRSWKRDTLRCSPIAWFPKGYSLDCETMRKIAEEVHTQCTTRGVHVPCESFDGQWHVLVVRDSNGEPLTMFQLQKDVWREVEKRSKSSLLSELKNMNRHAINLQVEKTEDTHTHLVATNGDIRLPKYKKSKEKVKNRHCEAEEVIDAPTLADAISDAVQVATGTDADVLARSHVTDELELDAFTSNVNDFAWCVEIEGLQDNAEIQETETTSNVKMPEQNVPEVQNSSGRLPVLTVADMTCVLSLLKTTKDANKNGKWNDVTEDQLLEYFQSVKQLSTFLDTHLRVITKYLRNSKGLTGIKESDRKAKKIKEIASFIGLQDDVPVARERLKTKKAKSLQELAYKTVSKYSKEELNVLMAEYKWPVAYSVWKSSIEEILVNDEHINWFYKPEYSTVREQMEVKCIDSTHLLTRMRRKSCRGGLDGLGNEAWLKVARQKRTLLTTIMVEDVIDPMSVSMAKTHFSGAVENEMRKNGDARTADLCHDIRSWWEAEDKSGISAVDRIQMRQPLRRRLMSRLNCAKFPPATQYVAGWPQQLLEATIANIDGKAYLYGLVHNMTYNVRAFSSLIGETFFSELTLNDKTGTGTVTTKKFGEFISHSTEQLQIRLDPERTFSYCTSKCKVYDIVDEADDESHETDVTETADRACSGIPGSSIRKNIHPRDHAFDMPHRRRLAGRQQVAHVSTDRNAVLKGALGVRWEKARTNYSKMLPTKRMGLE